MRNPVGVWRSVGEFNFRTCFVAGTLVKVHPDTVNSRQIKGESYKEIDQLRIGDLVLSADEHTGELSYRPVTELFVHDVKLIHRLTYKEGLTIETTWNHPFWVQDQGWTEAKDLHTGERSVTARSILKGKQPRLQTVSFTSKVQPGFDDPSLLTWDDAQEGTLSVARVEEVHRADKVYNIEVEGNHTYFVTEEGVLVHNYKQIDAQYGRVEAGDLLDAIVKKTGATKAEIMALNPGLTQENLKAGQKILLPKDAEERHQKALETALKTSLQEGDPEKLLEFLGNDAFERAKTAEEKVALLNAWAKTRGTQNLTPEQVNAVVAQAVKDSGVAPNQQASVTAMVHGVIQKESTQKHLNKDGTVVVNTNGGGNKGIDIGMMQLNSNTFPNYYKNAVDPVANLQTGINYFLSNLERPPTPEKAGAAYQEYNANGKKSPQAKTNRAGYCAKVYTPSSSEYKQCKGN